MWGREIKEHKTIGWVDKIRRYRNIHLGESCVVLGSGPSLKDIPIDFLEKFKLIGVNSSYRYIHPNYMVTCDTTFSGFSEIRERCNRLQTPFFVNWHWTPHTQADELKKEYRNEVYLPTYECDVDYTEKNIKLISHIHRAYESPEYFEHYGPSVLCSGVSEMAIPLALYMGFEKIYLAGVDFTENPTKDNHHFDNLSDEFEKVSWERWKLLDGNAYGRNGLWNIKRFSLEIIKDTCIAHKVFNLSEISTIKNIPKIHYSQVMI